MKIFTDKYLPELLSKKESPCLSLYMPTHRTHPDNAQDPIRFRNLLKKLQETFEREFDVGEGKSMFDQLHRLSEDREFWKYNLDGLAAFATPDFFEVYRLQRPVQELVVAADSLHTKPLQKYVQSADRYQVLVLSLDGVQVWEGNRYELDLTSLDPSVPATMEEALGSELTDEHFNTAFATGNGSNKSANEFTGNVVQGYGDKGEELDKDAERFFRAVDRAVLEAYSKPSGLPLILASLPEHHNLFHQVSHNKSLLKEGVRFNAAKLDKESLRKKVWEAFEPAYDARLSQMVERYGEAHAKGLGADRLEQVVTDTIAGKVDTVLIEEDRIIRGAIDRESGRIRYEQEKEEAVDDLLDDLSELVREYGGKSVIVPAGKIPSKSGVVSINRY